MRSFRGVAAKIIAQDMPSDSGYTPVVDVTMWVSLPMPTSVSRNLQQQSTEAQNSTGSSVLLSITAGWLVLVLALIIWFWKFNGAERFTNWMASGLPSHPPHPAQQQHHQQENDGKDQISEKAFQKLLMNHFRASNIHMVVNGNDVTIKRKNRGGSFTFPENVDVDDGSTSLDGNNLADDVTSGFNVDQRTSVGINDTENELESKCDHDVLDSSMRSCASQDTGYLALRTQQGDRLVPNCCAVCLSPYEAGDHVVWSLNEWCCHAFHERCVLDWLVKMQGTNPSLTCPCCRAVFVDKNLIVPCKTVDVLPV